MGEPILDVTDGTTSISLLRKNKQGIGLVDWTPAIAQLKGGGVYQSSAVSDGRRLVDYQHDNVVETFELAVTGVNQDNVAFQLQELRRLLNKARDYWASSHQDTPVYLKVRGPQETNTRYAIIHNWRTPQDDNPFTQPFWSKPNVLLDDFTLIIERGHWGSQIPGNGQCVQISNYKSPYGRAATCDNEVFVSNKQNLAELTHIYGYDATGPTWTSNLLSGSPPYNLFPAAPASGDIIYFGSTTGPFCSVIFDLSNVWNTSTVVWEIWTGASWAAMGVTTYRDDTTGFTVSGVNGFYFVQNILWATTTVNGQSAYWIRMRLTANPSPANVVQQVNRHIYSVIRSYVEIDEDEVGGDLPSLIRLNLTPHTLSATSWDGSFDRVILGLRMVSRGDNFTPYLNPEEQNPTGISFNTNGSEASTVVDMQAASGYSARYIPSGTDTLDARFYWEFASNDIMQEYKGRYRVFLRGYQAAGGSDGDVFFRVQMAQGHGDNVLSIVDWTGPTAYSLDVQFPTLFDMGVVTILGDAVDGEQVSQLHIIVELGGATSTFYITDVVLMPIDEWSLDTLDLSSGQFTSNYVVQDGSFLDIDCVTSPKLFLRTLVRETSSDDIMGFWLSKGTNQAVIHPNTNQRLYYLSSIVYPVTSDVGVSFVEPCPSVQMWANQRYYSYRGKQ